MGRQYSGVRTSDGKQCAKCKKLLPFTSFRSQLSNADGLSTRCRDCLGIADRERYGGNDRVKIAESRNVLKLHYVKLMGGQCERCGYNEFVSGLDFHHIRDKQHEIAALITKAAQSRIRTKYIATLEQEIEKCILLCRNCHSALHAGEWTLDGFELRPQKFVGAIQPKHEYTDLPLLNGF